MENIFTKEDLEKICDLITDAVVEARDRIEERDEYRKLLYKVVRYGMEKGWTL